MVLLLTIARSCSLAPCRKVKSFFDCHFCYMDIMLTNVWRCPLWNKFFKCMSIVCYFTFNLYINCIRPEFTCFVASKNKLSFSQVWCTTRLTFTLESNIPAKAFRSVVLPEDGGPNSRVILLRENNYPKVNWWMHLNVGNMRVIISDLIW